MARVFTAEGFRDTEPVFIEIKIDPLKLVAPKIIVYSSVSFIILLSLTVILCCIFSNKKKKKIVKAKEAAEADENLLSFTSYCVMDKRTLPKKSYDE